MAGYALRRIMVEYKQLILNPLEGIIAGAMNEENFFEWEASITRLGGTCCEGGIFLAKLVFPSDYPLSPSKMQFTFLHAPGMTRRAINQVQKDGDMFKVWKILLSVVIILAAPIDEAGANVEDAKMWRETEKNLTELMKRLLK